MNGAEVVLAVNMAVAAVFILGHTIIALANRDQRAALWFSATYLIGVLSPISDFLVPIIGAPALLEWLSYVSFLAALLSISATFALYHRRSPPWLTIALLLVSGVILRAAIWSLPRATLTFGMAYQLPFMAAAALAVRTVLRMADRRPLHLLLAMNYGIISLHFLAKPFIAVAFGPGARLEDYTRTIYALMSQASTGILLLVSGVILLLLVAQKAITETLLASETDPLSGLWNRRGFERLAQQALARAERQASPVSLAMFDLDHFKAINDRFGHEAGDQAIAGFATLLRSNAPGAAILARLGGEEFAMLLEVTSARTTWLHAEAIRMNAERAAAGSTSSTTVSTGVAELAGGETLARLLRRADLACYQAKHDGRNRVRLAADAPESFRSANVVRLEPARHGA